MYANGEVPLGLLVTRPTLTKDFCLMMPGTAAKHDRLTAMARAEYGWTPLVSGPDDAYRTLAAQRHYYNTMPPGMAAYPGTSSHGGTYNFGGGVIEQGAVDYGNFSQVGERIFFDLARRAGFIPGYFDGDGVPDEPWHVFDPTPWEAPAPTPSPTTPQEDEMLALDISGLYKATIGLRTFSHLIASDDPERIKNIVTADDKWTKTTLEELPVLFQRFDIDLKGVWDIRDLKTGKSVGAGTPGSDFMVADPLDGSVRPGNTWSRERVAEARQKRIEAQNARITKALGA